VQDALALVRSGDVCLLGAVAWWALDAAVLWAMLQALGAPPSLAVMVLAYFVGRIANSLPTPGAASGGLVAVLLAFGVEADLALAAVLAYRSVAIWLPAPIGLVALAGLRRTFARWAEEDASSAPVPAAAPLLTRHPEPVHLAVWPRQEPPVQVPA
jgi:putative heme transporter